MSIPEFDPKSLSVDERLDLIDKLWLSIATDAERGEKSTHSCSAPTRGKNFARERASAGISDTGFSSGGDVFASSL